MGCGKLFGNRHERTLLLQQLATQATSLDRDELESLPRRSLRIHLRVLGAPPSDYTNSQGLVDTVLSWNITEQFQSRRGKERASALQTVLEDKRISRDVFVRGLLRAGAEESECRRLQKKAAAKLLYKKLAPDSEAQEDDRASASADELTNISKEQDGPLEDVTSDVKECANKTPGENYQDPKERTTDNGESSSDHAQTNRDLSSAEVVQSDVMSLPAEPALEQKLDAVHAPDDADAELRSDAICLLQGARDTKFDNLDAELGSFLESADLDMAIGSTYQKLKGSSEGRRLEAAEPHTRRKSHDGAKMKNGRRSTSSGSRPSKAQGRTNDS